MATAPQPSNSNVKQVVPFFAVADMERSLRFYIDGLGFTIQFKWTPVDRIRWCWLELGGAALMLQEYSKEGPNSLAGKGKLGLGVTLSFQCQDALALYYEFTAKKLGPSEPFVGNHMWVTHLNDPDGYRIEFESRTDVLEETKLSEWKHR
jgi:lactoylglutathione lyase